MSTTTCTVAGCDRPTHDGWYVCESCGRDLAEALTDFAWMLDELDIVISLQARYATTAGKVARSDDEQPLPYNVKASEQRAYLVNAVATACRMVIDAHPEWLGDMFWARRDEPRHLSPVLAAAWLQHRLAGLRLHPAGGELREEIMRHWAACTWIIDRPAERRYLGICDRDEDYTKCGGRIYQRNGKPEARCDTCGRQYGELEVQLLQAIMVERLNGHQVTAAEAANLSTYMDLSIGRHEVRKRVNRWHSDHRLEPVGEVDGQVRFRFSEIHWLLIQDEARRQAS
jgi:hypothetical protein